MKRPRHLANSWSLTVILVTAYVLKLILSNFGGIKSLSTPLVGSDLTSFYLWVGRYWGNDPGLIGIPGGSTSIPGPHFDLHLILLTWLPYLVSQNAILAVNLVYFGIFLINAVIALSIVKKFVRSNVLQALYSIAVVTLPWPLGRLEHATLWLYTIPLLAITSGLLLDREIFLSSSGKRVIYMLATSFILGGSGPYLATFSLLILVANLLLFAYKKRWLVVKMLIQLLLLTICVIMISYVFLNQDLNILGELSKIDRVLLDSVVFGGYLTLLFIPVDSIIGLNLNKIEEFRSKLNSDVETQFYSNLGTYLVIASILLSLYLLFKPATHFDSFKNNQLESQSQTIQTLVHLNAFMILLFVKGGIGPLFSALAFEQLRAWNRILPILEITSILILFVFMEQKYANRTSRHGLVIQLILSVLVLSQFSQTIDFKESIRERRILLEEYTVVASKIEASGEDCAILQIPELPHDGRGAPEQMTTYDHFFGPLLEGNHDWSYGFTGKNFVKYFSNSRNLKVDLVFKRLKESGICFIAIDSYGLSYRDKDVLDSILQSYTIAIYLGDRMELRGLK
jgi:hypothetical protein